MSAKLKDIINCLNKYYDVKTQEEWDNSGLACGELECNINNITICLDVADEIIDNAINAGSELIISHHPIIFAPLYSLAGGGYKENLLIKAIKNDIAIYCLHTPADKAQSGINYANAEKLGLKNIFPVTSNDNIICPTAYSGEDLCNFIIGEVEEISASDFIKKVKTVFGLKYISAGGYMKGSIKKAAICGGAGKSFINDAISYGCDAYVTGDLSHHDYQKAYENKMVLVDATHYSSEKVFLEIIKNTLINEKIGFNDNNIKCYDQQDYFSKII